MKWIFNNILPVSGQNKIRKIQSYLRNFWMPIYRINKDDFTVIQIGHETTDPYIDQLVYGEEFTRKKIGHVRGWKIEGAIRYWEVRADLILFRSSLFRPPIKVSNRMLLVPYFVSQIVYLPPVAEDLLSSFKDQLGRHAKNDIKRIQRNEFEYEITRNKELLYNFYHKIYVPYVKKRFSNSADLVPWPVFRDLYGDKDLLLIRKEGRIAAGAVRQQIGNTYHSMLSGILLEEKYNFLKAGVGNALYWFTFIEAQRRGCCKVDLGTSRPFLKDGVLNYKKKWCSRVTKSRYREKLGLSLLFCSNSPALHRVLEINPFICEQNGKLTGLIFLGYHTKFDDNELGNYLKNIVIEGECVSICVILLNRNWIARKEMIKSILSTYIKGFNILNFSNNSIKDLPQLLYEGLTDVSP